MTTTENQTETRPAGGHRPHESETMTRRSVPMSSLILAYAGVLPFPIGALLTWTSGPFGIFFAALTLLWGSAILTFLAGVRRGLSFAVPEGPTAQQLGFMILHFALGAGALFIMTLSIGTPGAPPLAIAAGLQALGYAILAVADPIAAKRGETPKHFQRLRPVQMLVPVLSLVAILGYVLTGVPTPPVR